ncbi:MAG: glycosyltransferase family 4 protein [Rhodospirillales bacterium]|nr:glycosyltransferase family 4 protein [Rhodospirillales bacterium]
MDITLLIPARSGTAAAPHTYTAGLSAGLAAQGHAVRTLPLPGAHPRPDAAARAAALAAWAALPAATLAVIDGLVLPCFAGHGDALAARPAVGLIHHLTALEPGREASERAALRNTELRLLPRLSRIVAASPETGKRLAEEFGVDPARIGIVVPGAPEAPRAAGSGGPGCAILSVGALTPRKGHDVLIRALGRLFDLDWHLTIVGAARDPAHAAALAALVAALRLDGRVRFAGAPDAAALAALWHASDMFALASSWEGYPTTTAEALRHGLPVAATAAGGLVPPEAGVVCSPGDIDQLAKALRRMIFDADLRAAMAEAAWQAGRALPDWPAQATRFAAELARA